MRLSRLSFSALLMFGIGLLGCVALTELAYADNINFTDGMRAISYWETYGTAASDITPEWLRNNASSAKRMSWGTYSVGTGTEIGTETGTYSGTGSETVNLNTVEDGYLDPWGYYSYVNFEQAGSQNFYLYPNWNTATRGGEYDSTGTVKGSVSVSESGTVSISSSETLNYTETQQDGFYSAKITSAGASVGSGAAIFRINFGNNAMKNGTMFRLLWDNDGTFQYKGATGNWRNVTTTSVRVFRYYSNTYSELSNTNGYYTCDGNCSALLFVFTRSTIDLNAVNADHYFRLLTIPVILVDVNSSDIVNLTNQTIMNTTNVTSTVTQQTQQQTTALKDTSGSDGIVSGAVTNTQNSLVQKLGFVAQVPTIVTGIYQAVNNEGSGVVHFPGISWDGQTVWAEQDVPIVGWLPDSVQNPIRAFNTMLLFLAWLHGVHLIYLRIVRPIDAVGDEE